MEERGDVRGIALDANTRCFAPEMLRPIHELNTRLFVVLIDESRKPSVFPTSAALGGQLAPLSDEVLRRLAGVPISLVDAGFQHDEQWSAVSRPSPMQPLESHLPRARALELGALTFGLASTIARASRESARLIFGMSPAVADAFAGFSVDVVQWLSQARAPSIRPRWHDQPQEWRRLIATADHAEAARLPPVGVRAMNRLLADLEPATRAASEIQRSRG